MKRGLRFTHSYGPKAGFEIAYTACDHPDCPPDACARLAYVGPQADWPDPAAVLHEGDVEDWSPPLGPHALYGYCSTCGYARGRWDGAARCPNGCVQE